MKKREANAIKLAGIAERRRARARARVAAGEKTCTRNTCQQKNPQPLGDFGLSKQHADGRQAWCRKCLADNQLRRAYGISLDQKLAMLASQGHRCDACRDGIDRVSDAHVDHDHVANRVRGLLCGRCNMAMGLLNDSPDRIGLLLGYATRHAQLAISQVHGGDACPGRQKRYRATKDPS